MLCTKIPRGKHHAGTDVWIFESERVLGVKLVFQVVGEMIDEVDAVVKRLRIVLDCMKAAGVLYHAVGLDLWFDTVKVAEDGT